MKPIFEAPNECNEKDCKEFTLDGYDYCEKHQEYFYCECGQELEDAYGSPGDGFCIFCRQPVVF